MVTGDDGRLKAAVAVLYNRATADPVLAPWFAGVDLARLKAHQRAFLAMTLGGPDTFSGRSLGAAHAGLAITDAAFDAMLGHLASALIDVGMEGSAVDGLIDRIRPVRNDIVTAHPVEMP